MITMELRLLWIVATGGGVAAQLTADGAAMDAQFPTNLTLTDAQVIAGVDLVSLGLGQLSVSHALLHFGRWAEKGTGAGPPASTVQSKVLRLFYESRYESSRINYATFITS